MGGWNYGWRSAKPLIITTISIALFAETFLYSFIIPMLSYMLEVRLNVDPSETQWYTNALLTLHGLVALMAAPPIAHFTDKTPNRKGPFLIALAASLAGTYLIAIASSVWVLYLGRVIQGVGGSASWIVGYATLADNIGPEDMGKAMGLVMSFSLLGIVAGPTVGGTLLQLLGYWTAWTAPLAVLVLNIIVRLVMLERRDSLPSVPDPRTVASYSSDVSQGAVERQSQSQDEASTLLLSSSSQGYSSFNATPPKANPSDAPEQRPGFYGLMFREPRFLTGAANLLLYNIITAGFNTTLPLHLRGIFHWRSMTTGLIFLGLQLPQVILGPLIGCLRDLLGYRYLTTVGWVLLAPLLWLLGVPGSDTFSWSRPETHGKASFFTCITGIGVMLSLVRGGGALQMTRVMYELQSKDPTVFGDYGASSRLFSLIEIFFNLGLALGPLLSGLLVEAFSFYYTWGLFG
ncbi:MFS general substrate transporter [Aspergillus steynii IBT 23096]|uniref:MFS general substrate transporter n=1 Tax=Aspergillus steynii IBT 23096 TaxID=1392250 RepID=A0A2I2FUT9_9EURO|nr:MFS general substrate transporter [Aspergillus steynii IBT 23096]PLB44415.1 MFS general substrate transporter [Aspergillus steynii IBT 23096]